MTPLASPGPLPRHTLLLAIPGLCYFVLRRSISRTALLLAFVLGDNKDVVRGAAAWVWRSVPFTAVLYTLGLALAVVLALSFARTSTVRPSPPTWEGPGKVRLFPCKVTHTRTFPKKHSFDYSYLVVGIPVGWTGNAGGMVSAGEVTLSGLVSWWLRPDPLVGKAWYHVDAADYLERGSGHLGLRGKLDTYLTSQGLDPGMYPHAYLVTAAKFLGYHFNPVSFWYLYGADKVLAAMILEVNNTFNERRLYFLLPSESDAGRHTTRDAGTRASASDSTVSPEPLTRLTQTWQKDFHVSPFNSRKGSYSLNALDILSPGKHGSGSIDNTIVLRSSKQHGKLVARIFSQGPGIHPTDLTLLEKALFLACWWWVGFSTFPRIVKEAGVLFFKRKLHVWYRPEPLRDSIGRHADETERRLEAVFRRYLRHLVDNSSTALAVKYIPSGVPDSAKELMLSPSAARGGDGPEVQELEFKVLTPVFYTRFVSYAHDLEALFCELRESSTIWVSRPELLPRLVLKEAPPALVGAASYIDYISFRAIQRLRRGRPERIERPMTSSQATTKTPVTNAGGSSEDIRGFRISPMDGFVLAGQDTTLRRGYADAVLRLFLAERLALGMVPLLDAQRSVLDAAVAWGLARWLNAMVKGYWSDGRACIRR